jgi:hypothetical protein
VQFLKKTIKGGNIVEHFDDSAIWPNGDDFVWENNAVNFLLLENVLKSIDQLHGELL